MSDEDIDVGSKIRAYRKSKNLSLTELAQRTGIAASNLSSIELNKTSPTLGTIIKIADAFGMKTGPFLDEVLYQKAVVSRGLEDSSEENTPSGVRQRVLTDGVMLNRMDARVIVLAQGHGGVPADTPGTDRFVYCLEGSFTAHVDREDYHLSKSDSIYLLPAAEAHLATSDESGASILIVNTPGRKCPRY